MNAFTCLCGHQSYRHTEKVWPAWTPRCTDCDCSAYRPLRKYPQGVDSSTAV